MAGTFSDEPPDITPVETKLRKTNLPYTGKDLAGIDPGVADRFEAMAGEYQALTGEPLKLNSAFRTYERQAEIYKTARKGYASPPGESSHEKGLALDVDETQSHELDNLGLLKEFGFQRRLMGQTKSGVYEPWHIEPVPNWEKKASKVAATVLTTKGVFSDTPPQTKPQGVFSDIPPQIGGSPDTGPSLIDRGINLAKTFIQQPGSAEEAAAAGFTGEKVPQPATMPAPVKESAVPVAPAPAPPAVFAPDIAGNLKVYNDHLIQSGQEIDATARQLQDMKATLESGQPTPEDIAGFRGAVKNYEDMVAQHKEIFREAKGQERKYKRLFGEYQKDPETFYTKNPQYAPEGWISKKSRKDAAFSESIPKELWESRDQSTLGFSPPGWQKIGIEHRPQEGLRSAPDMGLPEQISSAISNLIGPSQEKQLSDAQLAAEAFKKKFAVYGGGKYETLRKDKPDSFYEQVGAAISGKLGATSEEKIAQAQIAAEAFRKDFSPQKFLREVYPEGEYGRTIRRLPSAIGSGVIGTAAGVGGFVELITQGKFGGEFAKAAKQWSDNLAPEDPNFVEKFGSGAGSMVGFAIPGIGVGMTAARFSQIAPKAAQWLGASVMAVSEAAIEADSVYREVLRETKEEPKALRASGLAFFANLPILVLTDKVAFFSNEARVLHRFLKGASTEGPQEGTQRIISDVATGKPVKFSEVAEDSAIGAILGSVMGAVASPKFLQRASEKFAKQQRADYLFRVQKGLVGAPTHETLQPAPEVPPEPGMAGPIPAPVSPISTQPRVEPTQKDVEAQVPGMAQDLQPEIAAPVPIPFNVREAINGLADTTAEGKHIRGTIAQAYFRLHPEKLGMPVHDIWGQLTDQDVADIQAKVPAAAAEIEKLQGRHETRQQEAIVLAQAQAAQEAAQGPQVAPPVVDKSRPASGPLFTPEQLETMTYDEYKALPPEQQKRFDRDVKAHQAEKEKVTTAKAEKKKPRLRKMKKAEVEILQKPPTLEEKPPEGSEAKGVETITPEYIAAKTGFKGTESWAKPNILPRDTDPQIGEMIGDHKVVQVWRTATAKDISGLLHITVQGPEGNWFSLKSTEVQKALKDRTLAKRHPHNVVPPTPTPPENVQQARGGEIETTQSKPEAKARGEGVPTRKVERPEKTFNEWLGEKGINRTEVMSDVDMGNFVGGMIMPTPNRTMRERGKLKSLTAKYERTLELQGQYSREVGKIIEEVPLDLTKESDRAELRVQEKRKARQAIYDKFPDLSPQQLPALRRITPKPKIDYAKVAAEQGYPADVGTALNRVMHDLAPRVGVNIDPPIFSGKTIEIDPSTPEGLQMARDHNLSEEEISDAIAEGYTFQVFGQHDILSRGNEKWSQITYHQDATPRDVYHEFAHAVSQQGKLPNWAGTEEEKARYLEEVLERGEEEKILEFAVDKGQPQTLEYGRRTGEVAPPASGVSAPGKPGVATDPVLSAIQEVQKTSPQADYAIRIKKIDRGKEVNVATGTVVSSTGSGKAVAIRYPHRKFDKFGTDDHDGSHLVWKKLYDEVKPSDRASVISIGFGDNKLEGQWLYSLSTGCGRNHMILAAIDAKLLPASTVKWMVSCHGSCYKNADQGALSGGSPISNLIAAARVELKKAQPGKATEYFLRLAKMLGVNISGFDKTSRTLIEGVRVSEYKIKNISYPGVTGKVKVADYGSLPTLMKRATGLLLSEPWSEKNVIPIKEAWKNTPLAKKEKIWRMVMQDGWGRDWLPQEATHPIVATAEQAEAYVSRMRQSEIDKINNSPAPFIRGNQAGDWLHEVNSGAWPAFVRALIKRGVTKKFAVVTAGIYVDVPMKDLRAIAKEFGPEGLDKLIVQVTGPIDFSPGEAALRIKGFEKLRRAGLAPVLRLITDEHRMGGAFLSDSKSIKQTLDYIIRSGLRPVDVLETPLHIDFAGFNISVPSVENIQNLTQRVQSLFQFSGEDAEASARQIIAYNQLRHGEGGGEQFLGLTYDNLRKNNLITPAQEKALKAAGFLYKMNLPDGRTVEGVFPARCCTTGKCLSCPPSCMSRVNRALRKVGDGLISESVADGLSQRPPEDVAVATQGARTDYSVRRKIRSPYDPINRMENITPQVPAIPKPNYSIRRREKAPTFYSQMQNHLEAKLPGKGTGPDLANLIEGWAAKGQFKADELKWSGLIPWLREQQGPVMRHQIIEKLKEGQVAVRVVEKKGGNRYLTDDELKELRELEELERMYGDEGMPELDEERLLELRNIESHGTEDTKFQSYLTDLPESFTNRREILLTVPRKTGRLDVAGFTKWADKVGFSKGQIEVELENPAELYDEYLTKSGKGTAVGFRVPSSHAYNDPAADVNRFAHVFTADYTDPKTGKEYLVITELQSDWAAKGRKEGYGKESMEDFQKRYRESGTLSETELAIFDKLPGAWENKYALQGKEGPPPLPFAKNWHEVALKKIIRFAAENGYGGLMVVNGEMVKSRYDLSKQVDDIQYRKLDDRYDADYRIFAHKDGSSVLTKDTKANELEGLVGKDIAQKIANGEGETGKAGLKVLKGDNLKVGGTWANNLYDKTIPSFLGKYVRQWGSEVGRKDVVTGEHFADASLANATMAPDVRTRVQEQLTPKTATLAAFPITPAMRDSVLYTGQRLFSVRRKPAPPRVPRPETTGTKRAVEEGIKYLFAGAGPTPETFKLFSKLWSNAKTTKHEYFPDISKKQMSMIAYYADLPFWRALEDPKFRKVYEVQTTRENLRNWANDDLLGELESSMRWWKRTPEDAKKSFRDAVWHFDGLRKEPTDEQLAKFGLDAEAVQHYRTMRELLDYIWDDDLSHLLSNLGMPKNKIEEMRRVRGKIAGFFPHLREGKYFVYAKTAGSEWTTRSKKDGSPVIYKSEQSANSAAIFLNKNKPDGNARVVETPQGWTLQYKKKASTQYFELFDDIIATLTGGKASPKAGKKIRELKAEHPGKTVQAGPITRMPEEAFWHVDTNNMQAIIDAAVNQAELPEGVESDDLRNSLLEAVARNLQARGFGEHFIPRKDVPGFDKSDPIKAVTRFIQSYNGYKTKLVAARAFSDALKDINPKSRDWKFASKYVRDMMANAEAMDRASDKLRAGFFMYFLGGVARQIILQPTQNFIAFVPAIQQYTKWSTAKISFEMAKASKDIVANIGLRLAGKEPKAVERRMTADEISAMEVSRKRGILSDQLTREYGTYLLSTMGKVGRGIMALSQFFIGNAEKFNRQTAWLVAYRVATKELGYDRLKAIDFAEKMVEMAHFRYGKANLPGLFRGGELEKLLRSSYAFRSFNANLLRLYAHLGTGGTGKAGKVFSADARRSQWGVLKGLLALLAFGGLSSLWGYKWLEKEVQKRTGKNIRTEIKRSLGSSADMINYGLPAAAGIDLSGSLGMESPQSFGDILGVPYTLYATPKTAIEYYRKGDYYRTLETISPSALKGPMKAMRWNQEGILTKGGKSIRSETGEKETFSLYEAFLKGASFRTVKEAEMQRRQEAKSNIRKPLTEDRQDLLDAYRIAVKRYGLDSKEVQEVRKQHDKFNEKLRENEINWIPKLDYKSRMGARRERETKSQRRERQAFP